MQVSQNHPSRLGSSERSTLASPGSQPSNSGAFLVLQNAGLLRQILRRFPFLTVYRQLVLFITFFLLLSAASGAWLWSSLPLQGLSAGLFLLLVIAFVGVSLLIAAGVARAALQPLDDLQTLIRQAKEAQAGLEIRQLVTRDPQIQGIAQEVNALLEMLSQARRQMRALSKHSIKAQEEERKRIARTLHDDTGQALTLLIFNLEQIEQRLPEGEEQLKAKTAAARQLAAQALENLRQTVQGLRPTILDDLGLVPAIRWYARSSLEAAGIRFQLDAPQENLELSPLLNTVLFRIAQEAVNNIVRHSEAKSASILIKTAGDEVYLQIDDDGRGFEHHQNLGPALGQRRWGLAGIQERVSLVNGQVDILSEPGCGALIQVHIPLDGEVGWQSE